MTRPPDSIWEAEESFRQLVSSVQDYAIFLLDSDGNVVSWNEGARRIKGYEEHEILGRHFSVFYPPEIVALGWPGHELKAASEAGRFEDEGWRVRKDGTRFWANVVISPLRSKQGELSGFLKITRDLTERRRASEELQESEAQLRSLVENVKDYAIFRLSPEGNVETWSMGADNIFGYERSEILGRSFSIFYPAESAERAPWELRTAASEGRVEDEGWRVRKDGSRFWANTVLTALFDSDQTLRGFAKITRDLTQRRQIEALREADRSKNEFLAILAHELRNPLATIRTVVEILRRGSQDPEPNRRACEMADRQVEHMVRLLDDLLDLARMNRTDLQLRTEPLDLVTVARESVEAFRSSMGARDLTFEAPCGPVAVRADRGRLEQIIANLLTNAAKYTEPGGRVRVRVERKGDQAYVSVQDTGIGIDPLVLPTIFDLFVQADRRLDRSAGGLGVGLTIVKRLTELHGGSVEAFSAGIGKGSEFLVRLPSIESVPEEIPPPPRSPEGSKLRVLVVDDNVDAADALALLLDIRDQETRVAYEAATATALAESFHPDVVFLDLEMPEVGGYELARRLRKAAGTRSARLVAVSGWDRAENLQRATEAGIDHFMTKPAQPAAIERLLAEVARARRDEAGK